MGPSFGGTQTPSLAALDERVKAADIIRYMTPYRDYAIDDANFCGSQYLPHRTRKTTRPHRGDVRPAQGRVGGLWRGRGRML